MSQLPENWTDKEVMEDSTIVLYPEADGQWLTQEERDATFRKTNLIYKENQ